MTRIEMTIPAGPQQIRPVRLVAASLATDLGFDVERVDDVKVAVDEMCSLYRSGTDGTVELVFDADDGRLAITGAFRGDGTIDAPDWLVLEILGETTDELDLPSAETPRFRLAWHDREQPG